MCSALLKKMESCITRGGRSFTEWKWTIEKLIWIPLRKSYARCWIGRARDASLAERMPRWRVAENRGLPVTPAPRLGSLSPAHYSRDTSPKLSLCTIPNFTYELTKYFLYEDFTSRCEFQWSLTSENVRMTKHGKVY